MKLTNKTKHKERTLKASNLKIRHKKTLIDYDKSFLLFN
ncbi:hypothetical protein SAMN05443667_101419 [Flavobacterium gillisiae]|uniref:Uncharacterized protein n=1 Tax=Flavobacterium gillisiae TaxID=150146 RepID=A0A1H3X865_9FLAO|nr:hypothetical protein SAMN05443667_101419 [Flavobacterium gillisiae]